MSATTSIEWTDRTWNPVTGCTKVSAGCKNCYAEAIARRVWGKRRFTDVQQHSERLAQPLRRREPQRWFVNSMSDLFHESVPDEFVAEVFAYMAVAHWHTFQVLTKRPARMVKLLRSDLFAALFDDVRSAQEDAEAILARRGEFDPLARTGDDVRARVFRLPLPNVWLGVSCEDQKAADERIPLLLQTPAALRFLSCEPLLAALDLRRFFPKPMFHCSECGRELMRSACRRCGTEDNPCTNELRGVDWVIVGGESGPGARPCDVEWIRSIVDQCRGDRVPVFVKQVGANVRDRNDRGFEAEVETHANGPRKGLPTDVEAWPTPVDVELNPNGWLQEYQSAPVRVRLADRKGGDMAEWPEDLRVREFPATLSELRGQIAQEFESSASQAGQPAARGADEARSRAAAQNQGGNCGREADGDPGGPAP